MAETNDYEAPGKIETSTSLERLYASRLLELHEKSFSYRYFYRLQVKGYLVLTIFIAMGVGYFAWIGLAPGAYVVIGMFVGVLFRDFGIARAQKKAWLIQRKLLDWQRVKRLAEGEYLE